MRTESKIQLGLAVAIMAALAVGYVRQLEAQATVRGEIAALRQQLRDLAALRQENLRLARTAAEVEDLRKESAAVGPLREEAATLGAQAQKRAAARAAAVPAPPDTSGEIFDVGKLDRPPQPKRSVRPEYPAELRAQGIGGEVVLSFVSDAQGIVRNVTTVRATHPAFEAAAIAAISQWGFEAGQKGGRSVNVRMQIPIAFNPKSPTGQAGTPALAGAGGKSERIVPPGWF